MSLFYNSKRRNIKMGNVIRKFWEISKPDSSKNLLVLVVIFFQVHLRKNQREWMKQNQPDDSKNKNPWKLGWIWHFKKIQYGILGREH